MSKKEEQTQTGVQAVTGGAVIPDGTTQLENIILASLMVPQKDPRANCDMGMPLVLWGLSGIGKSGIIKQAARRLGLPIEIVYPGTHAPEDFSSLPVVIDNKLMSACMLTQITTLNEAGGGVLFVDEVSCAAPAVQGAMLSMVLDRRVGAVKFHPNIRILMAANPPAYSAGGWGLEAPFANRIAHWYIREAPVDNLVDYILSEGAVRQQTIEQPRELLNSRWSEVWPKVKGSWVGFIRAHNSIRNQQPNADHVQAGYCWPSDRMWEAAFRSVATVRCLNMEPRLEQLMVESCVGEAAALEYVTWVRNADLPDPRDVLQNGWDIPRQLDRVHAVYASITALIVGLADGPEKYQLATQAWKRLDDLANNGQLDIVATHAQAFIGDGLGPTASGIPQQMKAISEDVVLKTGRVRNLTAQFRG